jgi:hypothetical protein
MESNIEKHRRIIFAQYLLKLIHKGKKSITFQFSIIILKIL